MVTEKNQSSTVDAIAQVRLLSTRLPRKMLMPMLSKPLLLRVLERVRQAKTVGRIVIATTSNPSDDEICSLCEANGIPYFRGSETDVLDRFYQTALAFGMKHILRVTPDDPFKDPEVIDLVVGHYLNEGKYDYVSNNLKATFPDGLDVEVFSFESLQRAALEAVLPSEREHVTPYIWKNSSKFRLYNVAHSEDLSQLRWTLDTPADYEFACKVYSKLYREGECFHMKDVLQLLASDATLRHTNAEGMKWEGYQKSLLQDKEFIKPKERD